MVYDEPRSGQRYTYQPQARYVTYAGKPSLATYSETVVFRYRDDAGIYYFDCPDGRTLKTMSLSFIFKYQY